MATKCKSGFKLRGKVCIRKDPVKNFLKGTDNGKKIIKRLIFTLGAVVILLFSVLISRGLLELGFLANLSPGWKIFWGVVGVLVIIIITLFLEVVFGIKRKK